MLYCGDGGDNLGFAVAVLGLWVGGVKEVMLKMMNSTPLWKELVELEDQ